MKSHGQYKIRYQRTSSREAPKGARSHDVDPVEHAIGTLHAAERRAARVVDSLHQEIVEAGDDAALRIRRIFIEPREVFRVELERPELGYQRTLLLGRDALELLLELEEIQPALVTLGPAG